MSRDFFPKAAVPSHLTKLDINSLPLETPFYIDPGEENDFYDPVAMYVTPDRTLNIQLSTEVDRQDANPSSPMGLAGIMKVAIIDGDNLIEGLIADLRFLEDGQLILADDEAPDSQEEFNAWMAAKADSRPIDAFIAPEADAEVSDEGLIDGLYYGSEIYHDTLDILRKRGDAILQAWQRRQQEAAQAAGKEGESATKNRTVTKTKK
jgi:hypothetical protein